MFKQKLKNKYIELQSKYNKLLHKNTQLLEKAQNVIDSFLGDSAHLKIGNNFSQNNIVKNAYDFSTVQSIMNISLPKYEPLHELTSPVDNIEYILQRKATEFKRNGRMDLAIACLKKSNEIMTHSNFSYQKDDYLRLIKYLQQDGQFEQAEKELELIKKAHPDLFFGDKMFNPQISKITKELVWFNASRICPYCSIYGNRVYSKNGMDNRFPSFSLLPNDLKVINCPKCNTSLGFLNYYDLDIDGNLRKTIKDSNRPFKDLRTKEEKEYYKSEATKKANSELAETEYLWLRQNLPNIAPKSLSGYTRMKSSKSANYQKIVSAAKEAGYPIVDNI